MRQVLTELERLRQRTRVMLFAQRVAVLAAWVLGVALVLVVSDYVLRLPGGVRLVLLAAGIIGFTIAFRRYLLPAVRFRPSLTQLALRAEGALPALRGRLASSVEFALAGIDEENALARRSVREAQRRLAGDSVGQIIRPGRTIRDVALGFAVVVVILLPALANPALAATGISRLLLPYGPAQWPARTAVASLMDEVLRDARVHPRGQVLTLRARNLTSGDEEGRVDVTYRLARDGEPGAWQTVVLTHQGGGVHERLVDSNAEVIELFFATEDAQTESERVDLVPPPSVTRASLTVTPPAYATGRVAPMNADLGPGLDERAITERPALAGSVVQLVLEMNKALPPPADGAAWVRTVFALDGDVPELPEIDAPPAEAGETSRWLLTWPLASTANLALELIDEHGLTNTEPIAYRIEMMEDLPPSAAITEPENDQAVLATAVVPLIGEATDDVGVARIALAAESRPGGSEAGAVLPFAPQREVTANVATIEAELDLAKFDLAEGDAVLITALADDIFEIDGQTHDTVRDPFAGWSS